MTDSTTHCSLPGIRRLLLATDGSQYSEGAVRESISLARQCSATLYAISVIEVLADYEGLSTLRFEEMQEAEAGERLEAVKDAASREGVTCEIIVAHGDPHAGIVEEARRARADLIVVGRRGLKGVEKALMGTVAARVIGDAPCNVLVVPRAAKIERRTVLVATDGSAHSNAAVSVAIELAKLRGGRLIALSALRDESERTAAQEHVNKVVEQGTKEGVAVEPLTPLGRSYDAIVETAGGRGADLIVMGAYGRTGLKKFFMGSSTERVIGRAGCAVLVVKAKN